MEAQKMKELEAKVWEKVFAMTNSQYRSGDGRKNQPLTVKQVKYAEGILSGKNKTKSAIEAGYSVASLNPTITYLTKSENVNKYINNRMKEEIEKTGVTVEWRLNMLKQIADTGLMVEGDKMMGNPTASLGAIAEINKMSGDYAPIKNLNANANFNVEVQEQELDEIIKLFEKDH